MRRFPAPLLLAALFAGVLPGTTRGQATLSTILSNGPTAKRINLVVLSEGYTTNQLGQFLVDATNAVNHLLAQLPYSAYKTYFNAFAISVASVESGSDHPNYALYVNTYFNSSFFDYGFERYLTIPPNSFDPNYAHGQGKVDALLAALMPEYDLVMMVVNDATYGGSGGPVLITSLNAESAEIVRHESGHTLGGLADEYESGAPGGYVWTEKPNSTAVTNLGQIKWNAWIPPGTPIPTPEQPAYATTVGLFAGAQYVSTGWYRPKLDCKMRTVQAYVTTPFCDVCSEHLVKSIYGMVRPIESFSPAATNLFLYSPQAVAFSVSVLHPHTHDLLPQWYTNNVAVVGATNAAFTLAPGALGNGTHTVRVVVSDPTVLVRTDPGGLLQQTNTWTLHVSLTDLALTSAEYLSGSRFRLTVTGAAPQGFVLQASTNLANWTPLITNSLANGKFDYTNLGLTNLSRRFYRAVSPP